MRHVAVLRMRWSLGSLLPAFEALALAVRSATAAFTGFAQAFTAAK